MADTARFLNVTELTGEEISREQFERLCHRYYWAGRYCEGKDVLEAACGSGPGLAYLAGQARSLKAGDFSAEVLARAKAPPGVELKVFDGQAMPFADASFDAVILFEALYYIPSAETFAAEAARVLRPGGVLLIATANKDLYDFAPSPHSFRYYGARELAALLKKAGFQPQLYGYLRTDEVSRKQQLLRPLKALAVKLNLIPQTMAGKRLLKRLVFGAPALMPASITGNMIDCTPPAPIPAERADTVHKVIYCAARKT